MTSASIHRRALMATRTLWVVSLATIALCYLNDLPFYTAGRDLITWLAVGLAIGGASEVVLAIGPASFARDPRRMLAAVVIAVVAVFVVQQLAVRDYHALRPLWASYGAMSDEAIARQWTQGNPYYPEEEQLRGAAALVRASESQRAAVLYLGPHRGDVVNEPFYPTPVYMPPRLQFEALAAATLAWSSWPDPVFDAVRANRMARLGDVSNAAAEVNAIIDRHDLRWLVRIDPNAASDAELVPIGGPMPTSEGAP